MRRLVFGWLLLLGVAPGCAGPWLYQPPDCAGESARPGDAPTRTLHVRLTLTHREREQRHEVAIESRPGRIDAIGLTPLGTVAYKLSHAPEGLSVRNRVGGFLGLDAERAYDAIVRGLLRPDATDVETRVERVEAGGVRVARPVCRYEATLRVLSDSATAPVSLLPR